MDTLHTSAMSLKDQIETSSVQLGRMVLALGIFGLLGLADSRAQADPIPLSVMSSLQPGTITAVHHETVSINGKEYGFDAEVQARDQDDNHLEVAAIRPNLEVKFHVKKNESNKIDLIIVYMPQ
ncbi:MAG: hypothetical protein K2X00_09135 [Nitrospiraceae bacterium]|jgi:hypothetical protein|nr:hypothetical protein [Nitrospiraceae bacterium]